MAATKARFQSTHPRGVRLAPLNALLTAILEVSIHAPAWGATWQLCWPCAGEWGFNPRTRVGCDEHVVISGDAEDVVSIHAPAWGATFLTLSWEPLFSCFNPRTRVGCDLGQARICWPMQQFQSTHPRGVRPGLGQTSPKPFGCFNPRTRVGCDLFALPDEGGLVAVSIHAPAWGATFYSPIFSIIEPCFNPRTRVGCDVLGSGETVEVSDLFQSTHPRGVRLLAALDTQVGELVSIHAPAWGATKLPVRVR